jgi:hypothetical protein
MFFSFNFKKYTYRETKKGTVSLLLQKTDFQLWHIPKSSHENVDPLMYVSVLL